MYVDIPDKLTGTEPIHEEGAGEGREVASLLQPTRVLRPQRRWTKILVQTFPGQLVFRYLYFP